MILFVVLSLSPNGATRIYLWPWLLLTSLLTLIPIVVMLALPRKAGIAIDLNVTLTLGLLSALLVLSAATSSHPTQSLEACLIPIGAISAVFLIPRTMSGDGPEIRRREVRLQQLIGAFGVAFGIVSMVGWIGGTLVPQWSHTSTLNDLVGSDTFDFRPLQFRNESPLGHANYTAGLALILLPWMAGLAIRHRGRPRWMWISATLLVVSVLFTAGSRGALFGVGAMAGTALLIRGLQRGIKGPRLMIGLAAVAIATGVFAMATPRVRSLVTDFATSRTLNSGDVQRWSMTEAGLRMGWDAPLLGQGPGLTPLTYPDYRSGLDGGVESALQLHSTPIQIWADLGLAGCLICLLLLGLILTHGFRTLTARVSDHALSPEPILASAIVSTIGYLAFSVTDYQLDVPVFAGLLAINLGIILAARSGNQTDSPESPIRFHSIRIAGIILLIPVLWATAQSLLARTTFSDAVTRLERHDIPGFLRGVSVAESHSQGNAFYPTSAGAGLLRLSFAEADLNRKAELESLAIDAFLKSLKKSDTQEIAHFNVGWLLLERDPESAERHFLRASELVPDKGGVYLGVGLARYEQNDREKAIDGFALEVVNDPTFITAPFWDIPIFSVMKQRVAERAVYVLTLLAGSPESGTRTRDQALETIGLIRDFTHKIPGIRMNPKGRVLIENLPTNSRERSEAIRTYLVTRHGSRVEPDIVAAYTGLLDPGRLDTKSLPWHPAGNEWPLVRIQRNERPAYGILMRNLDGPTPVDAYLVQKNGIIRDFYSSAFPPKGVLPTTAMVHAAEILEDDRS